MSVPAPRAPRITVRGDCPPDTEAAIRRAFSDGQVDASRAAALVDLPGHFTATATFPDRDVIVTSRSGAVAHYYDTTTSAAHGPSVTDVLDLARRAPRWNAAALADHLVHGHPLGDTTLDRDVRRVPAGAVLTAALPRPGLLVVPPRTREPEPPRAAARTALTALRAAVRDAARTPCALSMSGGLDARLLLAALLADGIAPRLLISGVAGSFDRTVALAIARDFGLPHDVHTVSEPTLVASADRVTAATDGLLPISNWAGMAHVAEAGRTEPVLFGYHGELARAYHLPALGRHAWPRTARPAEEAPTYLIERAGGDPFLPGERHRLADELREALRPEAMAERVRAALPRGTLQGTLLGASEAFFRTQYGHRKIAANLAAISTFTHWRVPLLAPGWSDAVQALPRSWKLGDRWHRWAIGLLCPALLRYPEERYGAVTSRRPPLRYWLRGPALPDTPFYADQKPLRAPGELLDGLAVADASALAPLLDPALVGEFARAQAGGSARPHLCFALSALAGWGRTVRLPLRSGRPDKERRCQGS
ncbi:hypothetical protein QMZ92_15845 [Streptomyces sp. HNM0645]|uniref:hypothetical protein n=1 Tax=Streptomyces sp. HNM0645 TaxID=2782343 RepID=UPI0024B6DC36|nr:hypothetical protein [Streptomyces sp. HNM0645]MDI9885813.1 hypothetical protein [Streptomyces sp. HNM0645]